MCFLKEVRNAPKHKMKTKHIFYFNGGGGTFWHLDRFLLQKLRQITKFLIYKSYNFLTTLGGVHVTASALFGKMYDGFEPVIYILCSLHWRTYNSLKHVLCSPLLGRMYDGFKSVICPPLL